MIPNKTSRLASACTTALIAAGAALLLPAAASLAQQKAPDLAPLPASKYNKDMAELGRFLFFDTRLSGDAAISCATCHNPDKGWGDGQPLSAGYPASEYFRNSPTILNAGFKTRFMWDGRLDGSDIGTLVRDMITEAHTMQADGRLVQERLKQVPEYNAMWQKFRKDDINGMRVFNVVGEFVKSIVSQNAPIDKFLKGDDSALGSEAKQGYALFKGKANCVSCHNGPLGSDGKLHRLGVPENPEVWNNPLRAITMLRHYATSGMPNYMNARTDVGGYAITKAEADRGKFATPSLRDLKYTAPYMHNGMFKTLDEVVDFYDRGGGAGSAVKPLRLNSDEKRALVAFLEAMSGDPVKVEVPKLPAYQSRVLGKN